MRSPRLLPHNHTKNNNTEIDPDISFEIIDIEQGCPGGAWKVAYADFVTAMMAFFLLMWLLNVTTDEQKNAISNYFDPTHPQISDQTSGAGGVMGGLTMSPEGAMSENKNPLIPQSQNTQRPRGEDKKSKKLQIHKAAEEKRFKTAAEKLKRAIQGNAKLAKLSKNIMIDMTPEGLRIQIVDQEGESMFPSGSAQMYDKTKELLTQISGIVQEMPNEISIRGHTDSAAYAKDATYTNWELSADRANSSRRVMLESGIPTERLNNVMGKADTEHLFPDTPLDARNRRISIILLKEELTNPDLFKEDEEDGYVEDEGTDEEIPPQPPVGTFRKTPGEVEFP